MTWEAIVGYATGLRLVAPDVEGTALLRTLVVIHLCHATTCAIFAHNNGYSKRWWALAGLVFGTWALATLIARVARRPPR